ncbi:MAG: heme-binding domain-containing protein [Chloroflexi bacterium]|nr:heme-binding domain-containing protein [Chloroflexota bacterium]
MKKIIGYIVIGSIILFGLIQLVPYGRNHNNPAVVAEPQWDSPATRDLAVRACYDCHSNETVWPWYANIAPVSWMVQHHTDEGRGELNLSEWGVRPYEIDDLSESIIEGEMPMRSYLITHAEARLTDAEKQQLIDGLDATFR